MSRQVADIPVKHRTALNEKTVQEIAESMLLVDGKHQFLYVAMKNGRDGVRPATSGSLQDTG